MAKVRTPVSGDDFSCHPDPPSDFAMIWPSSATLPDSFTHAESVRLPVICSAVGLPRSTYDVDPLNRRPVPFFAAVHVGVLTNVPEMPLPDESAVAVPEPSENPNVAIT